MKKVEDCLMKDELQLSAIKRFFCIFLYISMVLSLVGCGQNSNVPQITEITPAQTEAEQTEQTRDPLEEYLSKAQALIDGEAWDAATAVLEQAWVIEEDIRITQMLDQIEQMRPIPLDVIVSVGEISLKSGNAEIHDISAVLRQDGFVRYTVDYTATEGMLFQMEGIGLDHTSAFSTKGGRDSFVFEIQGTDLRAIGRKFKLFVGFSRSDCFYADVFTNWPEDVSSASYVCTLRQGDTVPINGCQIHSVTAQAVDQNLLYCNLDYTAPRPGMDILVSIGGREPFCWKWTDSGRRQCAFLLNRKDVQPGDDVHVRITSDIASNKGTSVDFTVEDFVLPDNFKTDVIREVESIPYGESNCIKGATYQTHCVSAQLIQSGMVRFLISYTAPDGIDEISMCAFSFVNGTTKGYPVVGQMGKSDIAEIYIPLEDLCSSAETHLKISGPTDREYYEVVISHAWYRNATEGIPVSEPVALPFTVTEQPSSGDYAFHSCTAQLLNNGYVRLQISFTAPEHIQCYLMDIRRSIDINCSTGSQSGEQNIVVDIPPDAPLNGGILGLRCNWLGGRGQIMYVDIDASAFYGKRQNTPTINIQVLYPA